MDFKTTQKHYPDWGDNLTLKKKDQVAVESVRPLFGWQDRISKDSESDDIVFKFAEMHCVKIFNFKLNGVAIRTIKELLKYRPLSDEVVRHLIYGPYTEYFTKTNETLKNLKGQSLSTETQDGKNSIAKNATAK